MKRNRFGVIKSIAGIVLIPLSAWVIWSFPYRPVTSAPSAEAVPATIAPEVKSDPKISTPIRGATVKTFTDGSKVKLRLPADVLANDNVHVIQASRVRADDHPQTVTTVLNTETGESQTYVKEEPLPWTALDPHGEAGIYYGIKNGERAVRAEVRQGLVQIKAVHVQAIASIDQATGPVSADYFAGVGAVYRW